LFDFQNKSGPSWKDGTAVHFALHIPHVLTAVGARVRDGLPVSGYQVLTYGTLGLELAASILLAAPIAGVWSRRLGLCSIAAVHCGIAVFMQNGVFQPALLVGLLALLAPADVDALLATRPGRAAARAVARVAQRFAPAVARAESSPIARLTLNLEAAYCMVFGFWMVSTALATNPGVPDALRFRWAFDLARAGRAFGVWQEWQHFAPEPPRFTTLLVVDARTADGRRFDPLAAVLRGDDAVLDAIPERIDMGMLAYNYAQMLAPRRAQRGGYVRALADWLLRYHERTGRLEDKIARFEVFWLIDAIPPAGDPSPPATQRAGVVAFDGLRMHFLAGHRPNRDDAEPAWEDDPRR
jgi:hypothetical protein